MNSSSERIVFLDWLRAAACLMVMVVHSVEPFYLGGEGTLILTRANGLWSTIIDSPFRSAVPLFVMISAFLMFPLKTDGVSFAKRRFTRVGLPLLVWLVLYSFVPMIGSTIGEYGFWRRLSHFFLNYPDAGGHLYFGFMILGVYLAMYLLSPWIKGASRREEEAVLVIWLFTTTVPFWRQLAVLVFGRPELWGEGNWNEFGLLYYVSGFIGYAILAHYLKKYCAGLSLKKTLLLSVPALVVGYAIISGWFWAVMPKDFPFEGPIDVAVYMEQSWRFSSIGVALMSFGYFLLFMRINSSGWFYSHIILPISKLSYGMYLCHIFILGGMLTFVSSWGIGTPLTILSTALLTYAASALFSKLVSLLPFGKYIVG